MITLKNIINYWDNVLVTLASTKYTNIKLQIHLTLYTPI